MSNPQQAYNLSPFNMLQWRLALSNVMQNISNARILCLGDSTTFGVDSTGNNTQWPQHTWPTILSSMLSNVGIPSQWGSFSGYGAASGIRGSASQDSRLVLGSGWTLDSNYTMGGNRLDYGSSGSNALSFTPIQPVDSFKVWNLTNATANVFSLDINGAGTTNFNLAGSIAIVTASIVGSLGVNTLNMKRVSGTGQIFNLAMESWNSAQASVNIMNAGWSGALASNLNTSTGETGTDVADPKPTLSFIGGDLIIICIGINDWNNSVSLSSFSTNVQGVITAALATGASVMLLAPVPSNPGTLSAPALSVQYGYVQTMQQLAATNNIPLIDIFSRWISYAVSSSFYGDGGTHPGGPGYADIARAIFNVITGI